MDIHGLQKITLLDYPGKVACTVFLAGCNFRCPFCHNASLVTHIDPGKKISEDDVIAFLKKRSGVLDGVCITGGEPLLSPGLEEFIRRIREMGYLVKLDTNGSQANRLISLAEKGLLDYVAMDIKNSLEKYAETVGCPGFDMTAVKESAALLMESDVDFEFRTTAVKPFHTAEDMEAIGQWLSGAPRYFLQTFVDSGNLVGEGCAPFSPSEMQELAEKARPWFKTVAIRGI